jgi:GAF domain-containing protein
MTVDGQLVARTVAELRAMPQAEDLLARLGRVVEVTRTVVGVDGTGLTLVHDDGPPRWVATTDAAMQLLEEVQHDFGEGPCLAAFAEDRVVAVQDLRTELVWDRIAVVVRQLQVRGVLSVPVRLADQPVGTLNVYATQPRAWSPAEVQALGAFAVVTAELVRTAVELANHQLEVAQLRQALASRVWIEQAKEMVAATEGVTLDEAFQQLRVRARSSSRKLADVAQEVIQEVQRARVAAKALDDARVRAAEARAREAEQDLQAAKTGLARRTAAQDRTQDDLAARERPPTSESSSPRNATGPLMTVTMSPTPVSGPRTCATGPPTNATATAPPTNATAPPTSATSPPPTPSSRGGQREQPAGTSSATPERFPRRRTDLRVTEQPSPPNHASSIHTMLGLTPAVARRLSSRPPRWPMPSASPG